MSFQFFRALHRQKRAGQPFRKKFKNNSIDFDWNHSKKGEFLALEHFPPISYPDLSPPPSFNFPFPLQTFQILAFPFAFFLADISLPFGADVIAFHLAHSFPGHHLARETCSDCIFHSASVSPFYYLQWRGEQVAFPYSVSIRPPIFGSMTVTHLQWQSNNTQVSTQSTANRWSLSICRPRLWVLLVLWFALSLRLPIRSAPLNDRNSLNVSDCLVATSQWVLMSLGSPFYSLPPSRTRKKEDNNYLLCVLPYNHTMLLCYYSSYTSITLTAAAVLTRALCNATFNTLQPKTPKQEI